MFNWQTVEYGLDTLVYSVWDWMSQFQFSSFTLLGFWIMSLLQGVDYVFHGVLLLSGIAKIRYTPASKD